MVHGSSFARVLAAVLLAGSATAVTADALDQLEAQCFAADYAAGIAADSRRNTTSDEHLASVRNAAARIPAMEKEARAIEVRADCWNLTTRCRALLAPAEDLEFVARRLANDLLGYADIEIDGLQKSSDQIARIRAQFERRLPILTESNKRYRLFTGQLAAQNALMAGLRCDRVLAEAHRRRVDALLEQDAAAWRGSPSPAAPKPAAPPPAADPFDEGRAMVDAGAALVPTGAIMAADLAGNWRATGYYCDGAEGPEMLRIAVGPSNELVATKMLGDRCVRSGEVSWRGMLDGRTIRGEFQGRDPANLDAPATANSASWTVVSRDEITGMGLVMRRDRTIP